MTVEKTCEIKKKGETYKLEQNACVRGMSTEPTDEDESRENNLTELEHLGAKDENRTFSGKLSVSIY